MLATLIKKIFAAVFDSLPQARDDLFAGRVSEDTASPVLVDVLANDRGGAAKKLYSLDNGTGLVDLLHKDTARSEAASSDRSAGGAAIWITPDGKVGYDLAASDAFKAELQALDQGEQLTDSFTYAIQLGNGVLSFARAQVQIAGANDAPVALAQTGSTDEDTVFHGTLVATDVDVEPLTYRILAPVEGVTVNADGSFTVEPLPGDQALNDGESRPVTFQYVANDGTVDSAPTSVTITITGVTDASPVEANDDSVITNVALGSDVVIPDAALLRNDTGGALGIAAALAVPADTAAHISPNVVFVDQAPAGGSFSYVASNGSQVDSAEVSVTTQGGDVLTGTAGSEILIASSGDDTLDAGAGDDVVIGGQGTNSLAGGSGADIFVYRANDMQPNSADTFRDFNPGEGDRLDVRDLLTGWGLADHSQAFALGYLDFDPIGVHSALLFDSDGSAGSASTLSSGAAFLFVDLSALDPAAFLIL
jgi:VCBS repeat-containing protein